MRGSTASTATIEPPARVIALVTRLRAPDAFCGSATRSVSENWADGTATGVDDREALEYGPREGVSDGNYSGACELRGGASGPDRESRKTVALGWSRAG